MSAPTWKSWPKVSPAKSGAANTKRYAKVKISGSNGGDGPSMTMGCHYIRGRRTLAEVIDERTRMYCPSRAGVNLTSSTGVAHVGFEPDASGLARVYQRFVLGEKTGAPRYYGGEVDVVSAPTETQATPRVLPAMDPRVETGPVKFGDDWTGVFVRGDNALTFARALSRVAVGTGDQLDRVTVLNLLAVLAGAREAQP